MKSNDQGKIFMIRIIDPSHESQVIKTGSVEMTDYPLPADTAINPQKLN